AVFGYFFPRKKVTRRKGGRGQWRHPIKWISPPFLSQPASQPAKPSQASRSSPPTIREANKNPAQAPG
ncbi:hypothetical protein, partial [Pseudomonas hunanensis]|uniref:hypothetical protein n=1 Tax=Pseudomonas hunanensis TaxID=1247546 RepID=UPI00286ADD05